MALTFTLTIDCSNAAFEEDQCAETARILRRAAILVEMQTDAALLSDVNGNEVGSFAFIVASDCYSDHNEDIRVKGSCDYCKGREKD